ncbi:MAG: hypothetical protein EOQ36_16380 [Mesorhizobium sp.]|nr:MAG: hypothetical protein EOQ36_16380 [Mesorhizobium sp.]
MAAAAAAACRCRSAIGVDASSQQTRPKAETCGRSGKDEPAKKQKSYFRRGAGRIQNPAGC